MAESSHLIHKVVALLVLKSIQHPHYTPAVAITKDDHHVYLSLDISYVSRMHLSLLVALDDHSAAIKRILSRHHLTVLA